MKLGFTGTRKGMSEWQIRRLREFLRFHRPASFHHGDCQGADAQAHKIVREMLPSCLIVVRPCDIAKLRANCRGEVVAVPCDPLERNRLIVGETDELIAAPFEDQEQQRGGTWYTIRLARREGRPVEVLERENPYITKDVSALTK